MLIIYFLEFLPCSLSFFSGVTYPWEAVPHISEWVWELVKNPPEGFTKYSEGVIVGKGVRIEDGATILPGAVISHGALIRQGAYLRGGVFIGEGATAGHATEVKNSILMDGSAAAHFNYVGDSILGCGAHLGAGVILSNLKADGGEVIVRGEGDFPTGLRKLGSIVGDGGEIGCGAVLNPGSVIGKGAVVYPLTSWRGALPSGYIAKDGATVVKKR